MSLHTRCGSSRPAGTSTQRPGDPVRAQLRHAPSQALSQQTPSTQKFDWHSSFALHETPLPLLPHDPLTQALGFTQSSSLVQVVAQPEPVHMKGSHCTCPGA